MTYKDMTKKYPGYQIIQKGYKDSRPFSMLNGVTDDTPILGYEVKEREIEYTDVTSAVFGGKKRPNPRYKGIVYVWYKSK